MIEEAQFQIIECTITKKEFAYQTHDALRVICQKK